ncbi:hypothetical protein MRBLPE1_003066 [Paenibacillus sp. LPE1-1-1.1]
MVSVSYSALAAKLKNSDNTLLDKLVNDGAVDAKAAQPVQRLFAAETEDRDAPDSKNGQDSASDHVGPTRIKLSFGNEEFIVNMYDNPTSRDFLGRLPLTLTFEDFGGLEKIRILDEGLATEGAPVGTTPTTGDFVYYAPWKDIAFFYADGQYSSDLIPLGKVESGVEELAEKLASMSDDFTMKIERID